MHQRRKLLRLKFLHTIYNNQTRIEKNLYSKQPRYISARQDNAQKIREYQCHINVFKQSFFPNTITDWNKLPNEVFLATNFADAIDNINFLFANTCFIYRFHYYLFFTDTFMYCILFVNYPSAILPHGRCGNS